MEDMALHELSWEEIMAVLLGVEPLLLRIVVDDRARQGQRGRQRDTERDRAAGEVSYCARAAGEGAAQTKKRPRDDVSSPHNESLIGPPLTFDSQSTHSELVSLPRPLSDTATLSELYVYLCIYVCISPLSVR